MQLRQIFEHSCNESDRVMLHPFVVQLVKVARRSVVDRINH